MCLVWTVSLIALNSWSHVSLLHSLLFVFAFQDLHLHSGPPGPTGTTSCCSYTVPLFCLILSPPRTDVTESSALQSGAWFVFGLHTVCARVVTQTSKPGPHSVSQTLLQGIKHIERSAKVLRLQTLYQCCSFYYRKTLCVYTVDINHPPHPAKGGFN